MPAVALGALMVGGSLLSAHSQKSAAKKQARAVEQANQANVAAHTMTPEEKAAYFAEGVGKVNQAYIGSQDLLSRSLSARGLGGNQLAQPMADLGRSRARSIGDVYSNLVKTAMNLRSGTPSAMPADPGPSVGSMFLGQMGGLAQGIGAYGGGQYAAQKWPKYFS